MVTDDRVQVYTRLSPEDAEEMDKQRETTGCRLQRSQWLLIAAREKLARDGDVSTAQ